jgi:hypothetical protein
MHCSKGEKDLTIFFTELEGYDDINELFERFSKNLHAVVFDKINGPYSRIWFLKMQGETFKLIVDDPYGSSLVAESESAIQKLIELVPVIEKFMK